MTRDEIIAMAREAGAYVYGQKEVIDVMFTQSTLERFAALVAAATLARTPPPPILCEAKDIDPEILRELLSKYRPIVSMPEPPDVAAAVAAEREACAKVCDSVTANWNAIHQTAGLASGECADAIRARSAQ